MRDDWDEQFGGNGNYPDLFQPYGGFPDCVKVEDGYLMMPELPGMLYFKLTTCFTC